MAKKAKSNLAKITQMLRNRWEGFARVFPRLASILRIGSKIVVIVFIMDIGYMTAIWPEWKWYTSGPVPRSTFIEHYEHESSQNPNLPRLRWQPVKLERIPPIMLKTLVAAEDSRFYQHEGIDTEAFKSAMEYNWQQKRIVYGASTISQQTVKNMFLSGSRNPLRKWHELILTWALERNLNKKRILELYLNVAEFGRGIYGIEAASRYYWNKPASRLTVIQAIELAATLPAPKKHNPRTRSSFFKKKRAKIMRNMGMKRK